MKSKIVSLLFIFVLLLSACSPQNKETPETLTPIRLPVGYIPNIQFAPLYVAIEKGFFREEGLDVTVDYNMEVDNLAQIAAGKLDFAMISGEQVLLGRAKGMPVVYVMAWYQKFPVGIAAPVSENIFKPEDLKGKRIGIPGLFGASYIGAKALLSTGGLSESDVTLDAIGFNQVEGITSGREQAAVVYIANEPVQLRALGYDITVLAVSDYMELVSNGLVTSEKIVKENPELVRKMVRALVKGLDATIANPDEAYELSKKHVENLAQADASVQKAVLTSSIELWKAERLGYSNPKGWENMQEVLLSMGLLNESQDLSKAFTNEFVP
ncbi:ABC transporter substrate-binding protein [Anaerolinea sp.]|uniref:ABC transporter substrate-binding protein n=1 Tax=Anaerolinea sp. TaxID=1872519 RepID=UPI002ACD4956|nr:ABC transporter substrate-binding protein [Anaerolinea sp.]